MLPARQKTMVCGAASSRQLAPEIRRLQYPRLTLSDSCVGGSIGRAAACAIRIGNAVDAAFTNRRTLGPVEARLMVVVGTLLLALSVLFYFYPRVPAYSLVVVFIWMALALLYRGYRLYRMGKPDR